ncbi:TPA: DNA-binding protein, partial [Klebsiella pneumoniae]|nr:DNA-binding protein [Klebsiella pneumoniae]
KQRPNVKKAQGFVVDEKERFENVYTFRSDTDESNNIDRNSEPSTDNEDLKLQHPDEMPKYLFEETE